LGQRRYSASAMMVDDAVAEEFQALVVRRAGAAMRQRLRQQRGSRSGDRSGRRVGGFSPAPVQVLMGSNLPTTSRLPISGDAHFVVDLEGPAAIVAVELELAGFTFSE
jgi:hypothetical protein